MQKYLLSRLVAIIPKNRVGTLGQSLYGEAHLLDENLESLIKFEWQSNFFFDEYVPFPLRIAAFAFKSVFQSNS